MKLNIRSEALFSKPNVNDGEDFDGDIGESEIIHNLPSTRFNINSPMHCSGPMHFSEYSS